jgi:hypothetical protein
MPKQMPSQQDLRMLLSYDHLTGELTWKKRDISLFSDGNHSAAHSRDKWNARWAGKEAFTAVKGDGYKHGAIYGENFSAHRIIWKWMAGEDPDNDIDHIDGDRQNNKWSNLRLATRAENLRNAARHKDNTSGTTGVRYVTKNKKWQAYIIKGRTFISLGSHTNLEDAIAARKKGEREYGFHPNHGRNSNPNPAA